MGMRRNANRNCWAFVSGEGDKRGWLKRSRIDKKQGSDVMMFGRTSQLSYRRSQARKYIIIMLLHKDKTNG
jgi:hypothetical protein